MEHEINTDAAAAGAAASATAFRKATIRRSTNMGGPGPPACKAVRYKVRNIIHMIQALYLSAGGLRSAVTSKTQLEISSVYNDSRKIT